MFRVTSCFSHPYIDLRQWSLKLPNIMFPIFCGCPVVATENLVHRSELLDFANLMHSIHYWSYWKEMSMRPSRSKHTLHEIAWIVWSIHYQHSKSYRRRRIHHLYCKAVSISDSSNFLVEWGIHTSTDSLRTSTQIIPCIQPRQTTNTGQQIYIWGLKMLLISPPRCLWYWSPWSTPL